MGLTPSVGGSGLEVADSSVRELSHGPSNRLLCAIAPTPEMNLSAAHCPPHVRIPTEDSDAWMWNPRHRWVYDRVAVAQSQGLDAGPHGTTPPRFPVFSKPIVNLQGMGLGTRVLRSADDYEQHCTAGHMWMTLLTGRHVSSDAAVVNGEAKWWRHVTGLPAGGGTFDHWTVHGDPEPALEATLGSWIAAHLAGFTGMVDVGLAARNRLRMYFLCARRKAPTIRST